VNAEWSKVDVASPGGGAVLSSKSNNSLRSFAIVEVECPAESRLTIDSALSSSIDRGRVDQSVFDALVVAFLNDSAFPVVGESDHEFNMLRQA
jgi:hypothetical protein